LRNYPKEAFYAIVAAGICKIVEKRTAEMLSKEL
jgi:hypothetical protein